MTQIRPKNSHPPPKGWMTVDCWLTVDLRQLSGLHNIEVPRPARREQWAQGPAGRQAVGNHLS